MIHITQNRKDNTVFIILKQLRGSTRDYHIYSYINEQSGGKINLFIDKSAVLIKITISHATRSLPHDFLNTTQIVTPKVEYDQSVDAAYINLVQVKPGEAAITHPLDPYETGAEINLDFNKDGKLLGIEVMNASKHLPKEILF